MPVVTATIEIDVPEGYEPVAIRAPKEYELFVNSAGQVIESQVSYAYGSCLIVRPQWQAPAWMPKGAWLYPMREWCFAKQTPTVRAEGSWYSPDYVHAHWLADLYGETFVPPPTREPIQIK